MYELEGLFVPNCAQSTGAELEEDIKSQVFPLEGTIRYDIKWHQKHMKGERAQKQDKLFHTRYPEYKYSRQFSIEPST